MEKQQVLEIVQKQYGAIARGERSGCGCGSNNREAVATAIGYSADDLALAGEGNLGLGCGNPLALAEIAPGMTVLDLGSGAGFDAFLAWQRVGPSGKVIGVDMTDDMLRRAQENASRLKASNVGFRKGLIEQLPIEDNAIDLVISNCVINLSPDKPAVFREIFRVLKPGGKFAVSDIVLLADLPEEIKLDMNSYVGCVSGASLLGDYVRFALDAGLADLCIPQVATLSGVASTATEDACCAGTTVAAHTIGSIKLHGRKSEAASHASGLRLQQIEP
jgi:arsenite methyltransferase